MTDEPEAPPERRWECSNCGAVCPAGRAPGLGRTCAWCGDARWLSKPNPAAEVARLAPIVDRAIELAEVKDTLAMTEPGFERECLVLASNTAYAGFRDALSAERKRRYGT